MFFQYTILFLKTWLNVPLSQIKARAVESMSGLHSLTLHGNPWGCDCGARPLLDWLVSANLPMVDTPRCHAPPRLAGQRFADIPLSKFACAPELLPGPRYVEANIGEWGQHEPVIRNPFKLFI